VPLLRRPETRALAGPLFAETGRRFRGVGWATLVLLVATGTLQTVYRAGSLATLGDATFWHAPFGRLLLLKLRLVGLVLVLSAIHDFWIGPRATDLWLKEPDAPRTHTWRFAATTMGRLNFGLGLVVVALAVGMVRGCG